jgi:ABC-type branched-subunit amino acid transport system ATPase component/ABC-type branched-subunit amino acid transport system permease subunit
MSEPRITGLSGPSDPYARPQGAVDLKDDRFPMVPVVIGAVTVALIVATQLFPKAYPLGVVALGAIVGTGSGLLAVGLVLTYRTTRIINFSYGAMGTIGAAVAAGLKLGKDVPWPVAGLAGVVAGIACGALIERLVIRRFVRAPRLVLTVATIGLAQLLGGIAYYIPGWLDAPKVINRAPNKLSEHGMNVGPVFINGNDYLLLAVVPIVLGFLSWFLLRTEAGMAVRGMAENMDRARLLGIPVNQLSLLLWAISGGLAALAVTLDVPNSGVTLNVAAGPTVLLPALAAAVVSGMSSLTRAFVAAVGLSVLNRLVVWNFPKEQAVYLLIFLAIILLALLLQRRPTSRALAAEESSWLTVSRARKLPRQLSSLPEVRVAKYGLLGVLGLVVLGTPFVAQTSQTHYATITLCYALAALSLVVLTGWGGVVSLGQVALVGVGAVVTGQLIVERNTDLFVSLGVAAISGGLIALIIGLPALRVSGQYLAVTTLAFAVTIDRYFLNPANFSNWLPDDVARPQLLGQFDLEKERNLYFLVLGLVVVTAVVVANLRRARAGRCIAATRDNPRAAAAVGVNTVETRLAGFVFAGMFAGLAGGLHVLTTGGVNNASYPASMSLLLFSMAVIGGSSSIGGTLAGVALVQWVGYVFPNTQLLLTGVGLLIILMVLPGGLSSAFERLRDAYVRAVARSRGIRMVEVLETIVEPVAPIVPVDTGEQAALTSGTGQLACEGVESSYGSMQVLFGIDTVVGQGELLALLGTNGAGKSTLLKSITGLLPPDRGRIVFEGRDITGMPAEKVAKLGLSLMPGGKGVFPTLTVAENLRLAGWMMRHDRKGRKAARDSALALFPILRERWDQLAGDLSGGEQQQLSLAMAFVTRPKLLCIDELSLGLAPTIVGQLVEKVKEIHRSGTSVVVVEQSVNVALLLCERAVFLEKGQVRFRGPTAGLLDRPDVLRAVFLGGAAGIRHEAPSDRPTRGVVLECRGLVKRFGGIRAVDCVDLTVPPATIVGLIGHNGAGKTTLFDVLTGFLPADGGQVLLGGQDVTEQPPHRRAIKALGRSFQEALLYPSLTVTESLKVALECHLANRDPLAAALCLPASLSSEKHAGQRAAELVDLLGLGIYRDHPTGELSTGTRRIVELGCLLAHDPAVVLLDEPSAGVAQRETEALGPLLRRVQMQTGCSLVVIEHDMALLSSLCDALVALEQGSVIAWGAPDDVLADHRVVGSYLGTEHEVVARSGHASRGMPGPRPERDPGWMSRTQERWT